MRYFLIFWESKFDGGKYTGMITQKSPKYVNFKEIVEAIESGIEVHWVGTNINLNTALTNIIELPESDFTEFSRDAPFLLKIEPGKKHDDTD